MASLKINNNKNILQVSSLISVPVSQTLKLMDFICFTRLNIKYFLVNLQTGA